MLQPIWLPTPLTNSVCEGHASQGSQGSLSEFPTSGLQYWGFANNPMTGLFCKSDFQDHWKNSSHSNLLKFLWALVNLPSELYHLCTNIIQRHKPYLTGRGVLWFFIFHSFILCLCNNSMPPKCCNFPVFFFAFSQACVSTILKKFLWKKPSWCVQFSLPLYRVLKLQRDRVKLPLLIHFNI